MSISSSYQKPSSILAPPNGRKVPLMDAILQRALSGRCLDEERMTVSKSRRPVVFTTLIERLLGSESIQITGDELNKRYSAFIDAKNREDEKKARNPPIVGSSSRVLRPRPQPATQNCTQTDSGSQVACGQGLYLTDALKWNIDSFQPDNADVAIQHQLSLECPKAPYLQTTSNMQVRTLVDTP